MGKRIRRIWSEKRSVALSSQQKVWSFENLPETTIIVKHLLFRCKIIDE